ncbi:uncharacterized protein TrAFT101_005551 [Trichoderma asperellum]|uniref:Uncharacterized protein n=1 Tax=Trichoderma asperellum (strain ATCC 204424 / CBS 433.97 / NBRC 101777) TaxID=1042311 RepID=A0A2T3YYD0_TRIA4|nr:hypothetical protein M441DRAFT_29928 [Trichoderma asperellum CBS 433.97]PTB37569.1 hypothetical protein M441DRAFT_29928 [Trichoderma asperellum CBS 433.97]UKZ90540.1 hypothetical protein TrAFT101_005551 [Trichoderma asperellum]
MGSEQITLFDLASQAPHTSWSLNPWKTRMLFNYKGLDYKTEWVDYPEIASRFSPHIPPNDGEGQKAYTIPIIQFPDGTYLMESGKIATAIENKYPSPTVHLDLPIVQRVDSLVDKCMPAMHPNLLYKFSQVVLSEKSYDYWVGAYTKKFGMPLDEYERQLGGEKSWAEALPAIIELTSLLKERQAEGPFFLGKDISYADFIWAGALMFVKRIDENVFQELLDRTGARDVHERFFEACAPWMKRDSY